MTRTDPGEKFKLSLCSKDQLMDGTGENTHPKRGPKCDFDTRLVWSADTCPTLTPEHGQWQGSHTPTQREEWVLRAIFQNPKISGLLFPLRAQAV